MRLLKCFSLLCAIFVSSHLQVAAATCSGSFNRYKPVDLDKFLADFDKENPGPATHFFGLSGRDPVVLEGFLYAKPQKWREDVISDALRLYDPDHPPSRYGLLLLSKAGRLTMMHAQDVVAHSILREIDELEKKTGKSFRQMPIKVWALHIANVKDRPVLSVACAITEDPFTALPVTPVTQQPQSSVLNDIVNGRKVIWYAPYWSKPENPTSMPTSNDDCDKLLSASDEANVIHFIEGRQFKTHDLWGSAATEQQRREWLIPIDPVTGNLRQNELISAQVDRGTIIIVSKSRDGKARKLGVTQLGLERFLISDLGPANPTPAEAKDFEESKKLGLFPPRIALVCSKESYSKHLQKRSSGSSAIPMPSDALAYVLDKKWAIVSCSQAKIFSIFSRQYAAGRATLTGDKIETTAADRATHAFRRINAMSFEHSVTIKGDKALLQLLRSNDTNLVSGQVSNIITLIRPDRIDISSVIKSADFLVAAEKGRLVYETRKESGSMNLCS